ncbi:malectin domain-containing carbohydrate-binding protein [Asticcacaulis sp.]|uniref:malectin domain-containing carbohydrate-binding protein n=1 Tax=Asticcacaulis sp. TaxID=1872648 RepID=UPI002C4B5574|nr:malectin domain-containing carbohydrate-binding protein [Asticcacaulis sp.]HTM81331.1 malectin domain-containing carbohydrate-binding protein [Asticcacaulis sp.]
MSAYRLFARLFVLLILAVALPAAAAPSDREIAGPWRSALFEADANGKTTGADNAYQAAAFADKTWTSVSVPHNWQGYTYARQVVNGSRHGTAWYRKAIDIPDHSADERVFLMFEGVNAYATIWLNGKPVGKHGGGLTTFTVDVTDAVQKGQNLLAVRVDNPAGIRDLPWAAGDDNPMNGFAEGSQPFGIFRPVHVIVKSALRVQSFGLYAWGTKDTITAVSATLNVRSELENLSAKARKFQLVDELVDKDGKVVASVTRNSELAAGEKARVDQVFPAIANPHLWSPATPYLYTLRARLIENGQVIDESETPYGIRYLEIATNADSTRQLMINGQPFFIHGTAEYEHLLGNSHAFSPEQIRARIEQVKAGGFNAFRDAHYPHNLRYQAILEQEGMMWWPQFSAHNWNDNPAFRANFLSLLRDWVRERRNNPANFMWGLQNESTLPEEFVAEAMKVIRDLDPTASVERLIVTCNGGKGADWNVPQNWSGTYGGDPEKYGEELKTQSLVGEYGAWRSLGLHSERPYPVTAAYDESSMTQILETKSRLAESVKNQVVGDFVWLLTTHENPGRPMKVDGTQIFDGIRPLEHIGPANNKGLMTLWGEPLDAYYMLRARAIPASQTPIVYIVSHTWPDRWTAPGVKSGIEVFSNCDQVELFNDVTGKVSLGVKDKAADGKPFVWDKANIRYNALSATCLIHGKVAARDVVTLNNLPPAPDLAALVTDRTDITKGAAGASYLYRVNAGGSDYTDADGQLWLGDRHLTDGARWGWKSWADDYPDLDPALGSRRVQYDPVEGTSEQGLFKTYRFGRDRLVYSFAAPKGVYEVELYFAEPWYGRTGINATGWRLFDVAVNGKTALKDVDLYKEAGFEHVVKKVIKATSVDGRIVISFPHVAAGQAVISAIAIRKAGKGATYAADGTDLIDGKGAHSFLDNGDAVGVGKLTWSRLPMDLLDSDWTTGSFHTRVDSDVYLPLRTGDSTPTGWAETDLKAEWIGEGGASVRFVSRRFAAGETVAVETANPLLVRRHLPSPYAPGVFTFVKTTGLFEAETARFDKGVIASNLKGYGGPGYVEIQAGGNITWSVTYGAAAMHSFRFRYQGATNGHLTLTDESGIVAADMPVSLPAGEKGVWQEVTIETPTLINAGTYALRLTTDAGVIVDSLRMQ